MRPNSLLLVTAAFFMGAGVIRAEEATMPPRQMLLEKAVELPTNKVNARVVRVIFPRNRRTVRAPNPPR